ncbi:hypothetical protein M413DRAFT_19586 [Hebeloma cylindrosporum]|uniref:Major facilitator superfamily (MFS) profile domain-containing protein n=1 Tax=Hebeloma cylindrosporum TaxID=76867 RepID=A0A0C3C883_HEBCY|nr:hypothetical protein M413DRAFT_19586 [Hebeloma cylindrosporum h7]
MTAELPEWGVASDKKSDESSPLLGGQPSNKPFYRARPLWLVPFAITASLVRGMTLAPRVQVFTQLSCNKLHGSHNWNHTQISPHPPSHISLYASIDPLGPQLHPSTLFPTTEIPLIFSSNFTTTTTHRDDEQDSDERPSTRCRTDPAVQAGAARLQTMMTTTMGLLSAFTTGWWGHFGERHGRTRVLAFATFGLFMTDLTFILVSTPTSPFAKYGPNLLLIAPVIEGLLGGWSTLQSATSAYLSDCTSPGSRAQIFSRFTGVFYLGFAVGPSIGGWLIRHPFGKQLEEQSDTVVTTVFWVAVFCSLTNFILVLFVFPESLDKKRMEKTMSSRKGKAKALSSTEEEEEEEDQAGFPVSSSSAIQGGHGPQGRRRDEGQTGGEGMISGFLKPLAVFLPVVVLVPSPNGLGRRKKRDWSLTLLAVALLGFMLSSGLYQIKYLYAVHTYSWGAEQLSYYISFMGGGKAVFLLFILPSLIKYFKPKPLSHPTQVVEEHGSTRNGKMASSELAQAAPVVRKGKKPKPTRAQLGQEIKFDLMLARCSLMMEMISHSLVTILPSPSLGLNRVLAQGGDSSDFKRSQAMFVGASSLNGLGSGALPAIHSVALCMMQVRALDAKAAAPEVDSKDEEGTGALFGALAVLQAVGQMILGPMLFGVIYSGTVATFPKAIFVVGAGIMVLSLTVMLCVRNPVRPRPNLRRGREENERGRSRVSKDLRGGAIGYDAC